MWEGNPAQWKRATCLPTYVSASWLGEQRMVGPLKTSQISACTQQLNEPQCSAKPVHPSVFCFFNTKTAQKHLFVFPDEQGLLGLQNSSHRPCMIRICVAGYRSSRPPEIVSELLPQALSPETLSAHLFMYNSSRERLNGSSPRTASLKKRRLYTYNQDRHKYILHTEPSTTLCTIQQQDTTYCRPLHSSTRSHSKTYSRPKQETIYITKT